MNPALPPVSPVPWWVRFSAKMALTAAPLDTRWLKRVSLFNHGDMEKPGYAAEVFDIHFAAFRQYSPQEGGFTCLELGPGDSLFSALLAKACGASRTWLVDRGDYALRDIELYRAMARRAGLSTLASERYATTGSILDACGAQYLTNGIDSLRSLPSGSIDFSWSHAVLHAVKHDEFEQTLCELRRLMRPGGICSHEVDLRDMFGGSLNHLRFPQRFWESGWVTRSGLYSNRIGFSPMLRAFERAGFHPVSIRSKQWESLPVAREKFSPPFWEAPERDLLVHGFRGVFRAV